MGGKSESNCAAQMGGIYKCKKKEMHTHLVWCAPKIPSPSHEARAARYKQEGHGPRRTCTSTTAPITWVTRPAEAKAGAEEL